MTPELQYLVWGVLLLLGHIAIQATLSDLSKGIGWALGARDIPRDQNATAARMERALVNFLQTFVGFVAVSLALSVTEMGTEVTALGAAMWFWARVVYVPAYICGVPLLRSIAWFVSIAGLIIMLLPLV